MKIGSWSGQFANGAVRVEIFPECLTETIGQLQVKASSLSSTAPQIRAFLVGALETETLLLLTVVYTW